MLGRGPNDDEARGRGRAIGVVASDEPKDSRSWSSGIDAVKP
jgi:hypothetical protein